MTAAPISEITVEANGLRFGALAAGDDGPLALCLHGFPDSAWTWRHLLPELAAAGFRAVAPFLRGFAPTEIPADGLYQPGVIASDANALHESLGGDGDAVLIGHDWGALASYSAVNDQPERWRRLVSAAVPPPDAVAAGFFTWDQLKKSWYMFFFQSPFAEMAVAMDDLAFIDHLWEDWSPGFDDPWYVERAKDTIREPANLAAAIAYYRATVGTGPRSPEHDAIEVAGSQPVAQPHLYLHGRDDGCMGVSIVERHLSLRSGDPRFELAIIDDAGHFLQLEQPEVVNRLIVDFATAP